MREKDLEKNLQKIILDLKAGIESLKSGTERIRKSLNKLDKEIQEAIEREKSLEKISERKIIKDIEKPKDEIFEEVFKSKEKLIEIEGLKSFLLSILEGSSISVNYARSITENFSEMIENKGSFLDTKNMKKLKTFAHVLGIDLNLSKEKMLREVAKKALEAFSQYNEDLALINRAPNSLVEKWRKCKVIPRGIYREIVDLLYGISMKLDNYHELFQAIRCVLADGWGASMIATELKDIILEDFQPVKVIVGIGENVIRSDMVNVAVYEGDYLIVLSLIEASKDPEILKLAEKVGAKGVNLFGIGCVDNEIFFRKGIPVAGLISNIESILATQAVEAIIINPQWMTRDVMQITNKFHTVIIATNSNLPLEKVININFDRKSFLESAKEILKVAVFQYPKRDFSRVNIPNREVKIVADFNLERLMYSMGGKFRTSLKFLNDNIINGRVLGVAFIIGDDRFRIKEDVQVELIKELIANNVIVLTTGNFVIEPEVANFLTPEAVQFAGEGLKEFLEAIGLPPVLHVGSFIDNSRILMIAAEMVNIGGLGRDICELPLLGCVPQGISTKEISVSTYFVTSGIQMVMGPDFPMIKDKKITTFLFEEINKYFGASFKMVKKEQELVNIIIDGIKIKRKELGMDKPKHRVLYDMGMRRALDEERYIPFIHRVEGFREDK